MRKIKDAVVVVGEYQGQDGQPKKRYKNVGSLMEGDDGGHFLFLDRHFNPAGVGDSSRESIIINFYEPKKKEQQTGNAGVASQNMQMPPQQPADNGFIEDPIPF